MQYKKVQSAAKRILSRMDPALERTVLDTMRRISDIVGGTLGPGGRPVLIERYETDLPPVVTKDGVTVFNSLGFVDSMAQTLMESTRDSARHVAKEAGDGTTTTTILSEAIVRLMYEYRAKHPAVSPQRIISQIEGVFIETIEPLIRGLALGTRPARAKRGPKISLEKPRGRKLLRDVARISANGDAPLADAVLEAFEICGDAGNVTISEEGGQGGYNVEEIRGYPIFAGYEDSAGSLAPQFLNDRALARTVLAEPLFLLHHGEVNDTSVLYHVIEMLGSLWENKQAPGALVVCATGFSDRVLGDLALSFPRSDTMSVLPLRAPMLQIQNSQLNFLEDLASVTGGVVYDPISRPLRTATLEGIGAVKREDGSWGSRLDRLEMTRARTYVFGEGSADDRAFRVSVLEASLPSALGQFDATIIRERMAALSGGIAKIRVLGSSNGETKERRDRVDDAVCAVRGAIKEGVLYGGGHTLVRAAHGVFEKYHDDDIVLKILIPALLTPVRRLLENVGMSDPEIDAVVRALTEDDALVFDVLEGAFRQTKEAGIYDSVPAVLEAIRAALSIALRNGTLGGIVAFARDGVLERSEAQEAAAINGVLDGSREFVNEANARP